MTDLIKRLRRMNRISESCIMTAMKRSSTSDLTAITQRWTYFNYFFFYLPSSFRFLYRKGCAGRNGDFGVATKEKTQWKGAIISNLFPPSVALFPFWCLIEPMVTRDAAVSISASKAVLLPSCEMQSLRDRAIIAHHVPSSALTASSVF